MPRKELAVDNVAEAYLALLADRGVEYLFANAGTDFAPIVEAYAKAAHTGIAAPKPLLATHENLAMSMAHGYAAASGKVPAVMVHVSVGTANALCGVLNAARENVPVPSRPSTRLHSMACSCYNLYLRAQRMTPPRQRLERRWK